MKKRWKVIGLERASQHHLYGVKGWLLLFVIANFVGPVLSLGGLNTQALRYHLTLGQLLSIDTPEVIFMSTALYLELALSAATVFLVFTKSIHFRRVAIVGRMALFPVLAAVAFSQGISDTCDMLARTFFPWAVNTAIWVPYLQMSKRVRVTFEHCVRDDSSPAEDQPSYQVSASVNISEAVAKLKDDMSYDYWSRVFSGTLISMLVLILVVAVVTSK